MIERFHLPLIILLLGLLMRNIIGWYEWFQELNASLLKEIEEDV